MGVLRLGRVQCQCLEACEQDDQDEDEVEIKTNSDFRLKSNFRIKLF